MSAGLNKELAYSQQFVDPLLNTLKFITEQVGIALLTPVLPSLSNSHGACQVEQASLPGDQTYLQQKAKCWLDHDYK